VDPADPGANNELAWFLATTPETRLREPAESVRLARKAVQTEKSSSTYWNTLGVALYRHGDDKAAVEALETSLRLTEGGDCYDWYYLALAHARLGDRDKARTWFDRAEQWMDRHKIQSEELRRFRTEAKALLARL
jgi:uncharacterized protein HemY